MSTERTPLETIHALREATEQIAELKAELTRKDAEIEALRNPWISVEELDKELAPVFQALDWGETRNAISLLAEARTRLTAAATNNTNDNG